MALDFGWELDDVRESYWPDDPAFLNDDGTSRIPAAAREAWKADGDSSHFRQFVRKDGPKPTRLTFRVLNTNEARIAKGVIGDVTSATEYLDRAYLLAFRMGVDLPDLPPEIRGTDGAMHPRIALDHGVRMMSDNLVRFIERRYKGMVDFYGRLIFDATFPTEQEKKVSSPSSTANGSGNTTAQPITAEPLGAPA